MLDTIKIVISREPDAMDLPLPRYATAGAAGLDLCAATDGELTLAPGARALVSTGIRLALPTGCEGQVRPRSGLAWRHGLTLLNAPGTIDADYRGVIKVILINLGQEPVRVKRGDRIAQLVIAPVPHIDWSEQDIETLDIGTLEGRGEDGFGSTGQ